MRELGGVGRDDGSPATGSPLPHCGRRHPLSPEARAVARSLRSIVMRLPAWRQAELAVDPFYRSEFAGAVDALEELSVRPSSMTYRLVTEAGERVIVAACAIGPTRRKGGKGQISSPRHAPGTGDSELLGQSQNPGRGV